MLSPAYRAMSEKLAAMPAVARTAARWLTNSASRGALVGAGLGAAHGAATNQEPGGGLHSTVRGAVRGALLGGAAAGTGRAFRDVRLLNPSMTAGQAAAATVQGGAKAVQNFGKRQVHGLTGTYDPTTIGMNSSASKFRDNQLIFARRRDAMAHGEKAITHRQALEQSAALVDEGRRGDANIRAGITSIPGIARGLAHRPGETLHAVKNEVLSGGRMGKAIATIPLAQGAYDVSRGDETATGGRNIKQKLVSAGVNTLGGALVSGLPVVPQIAAMTGFDAAAHKLVGARQKPVTP